MIDTNLLTDTIECTREFSVKNSPPLGAQQSHFQPERIRIRYDSMPATDNKWNWRYVDVSGPRINKNGSLSSHIRYECTFFEFSTFREPPTWLLLLIEQYMPTLSSYSKGDASHDH